MENQLREANSIFQGSMLAEAEVKAPALAALCGFAPSCLQPWLAAGERVPALLEPSLRAQLKGYSPEAAIAAQLDPDRIRDRHPLDKAQYVWIKTMLEGQILTWGGDRVDMANSMEARPAFLDHHLAEYARTVPPSMRIHGRTEKYVLREAMRGLLPDVLYRREKFAFMAPPAHTDAHQRRALQQLADRHLSEDRVRDTGLLDIEGVRSVFALHDAADTTPATRVQLDAVINHLIGIQILHQQFIAADLPRRAVESASELGWAA
jgi:asparagine synthase (glutamine-hydrolysing)